MLSLAGSKFFHFRVDFFFSEGTWCAEKRIGSHNSFRPCLKGQKMYRMYQVPLRCYAFFDKYLSLENPFEFLFMEEKKHYCICKKLRA